jgi:hypothetical protein
MARIVGASNNISKEEKEEEEEEEEEEGSEGDEADEFNFLLIFFKGANFVLFARVFFSALSPPFFSLSGVFGALHSSPSCTGGKSYLIFCVSASELNAC